MDMHEHDDADENSVDDTDHSHYRLSESPASQSPRETTGDDGEFCDGGQHSDGYHRHDSEGERCDRGDVGDGDEGDRDDSDEYEMSLEELMYGASSYHAIAKPVSLTMILAASAAVFVNTEESLIAGEQQLAEAYQVWKVDDSDGQASTGTTLARSLGNAFVMVSFLCAMTFVIVLLYKLRFMKCLIGYMIFTSATLLGLMGGAMLDIAIEKYQIPIDIFSYYFGLYNFAAVGTTAIFWQLGVPSFITQGYLVATSVILAWHLSHFDEWTAWTLLVMLALYDLCAVLTPCGPLKALVNAMQEEDAPEMPGLLYEAQLEGGAGRTQAESRSEGNNGGVRRSSCNRSAVGNSADKSATAEREDREELHPSSESPRRNTQSDSQHDSLGRRSVIIPFAIAKVYNLPLISPPSDLMTDSQTRANRSRARNSSSNVDPSSLLAENSEDQQAQNFSYSGSYTTQQLRMEVRAQLPTNGGRIERRTEEDGNVQYTVFDRNGEEKRVLLVNSKGNVFEVLNDDDESAQGHGGKFSNSIRLGLGDFIFYSVMVAKAAMYSFTTFAACMLVILAGLGVTLVLLAVYHHALPALPVSIFLGVLFYVLTRLSIEPWVHDVLRMPMYV